MRMKNLGTKKMIKVTVNINSNMYKYLSKVL